MTLKAVIFDMDGVLVDTEIAYAQVIGNFFLERGLPLAQADITQFAGGSGDLYRDSIALWWEQTPNLSHADLALGAEKALDKAIEREIPCYSNLLNPGVKVTLDQLRRRGIRTALASSSSRAEIERITHECGIAEAFEVLVSGEDFAESKPNPAIYLHTLELMGLDADECVAVEDSDRGIAAARAAGIPVAVKRDDRFGFSQAGGTWYLNQVDDLLGALFGDDGQSHLPR